MPRHHRWRSAIFIAGLCIFSGVSAGAQTKPSGWQLLRTSNSRGGREAVSIYHTADIMRSDLDLAGLMLRCNDAATSGPRAEVVLVVVTPFPPRAQPSVVIDADGKQWRFAGSVVPPGAELLLPAEATDLAAGMWQSTHELAVKISSPEQSFGGIIPIDGLAGALGTLATSCPAG